MNTVTESIYSGKTLIVPLADVQHIETHNPLGIIVVTKHTRWNKDGDFWANSIWIDAAEAGAFKTAWCRYRSELEAHSLADLSPHATLTAPVAGADASEAKIAALTGALERISNIADGRDRLDGFPRSNSERQRRLSEIKVVAAEVAALTLGVQSNG